MAYRVEGQSVTLYLDCVKLVTLDVLRGPDPEVSLEGVTVFGTRLLDDDVFEVGMQICASVYMCVCLRMLCSKTWSELRTKDELNGGERER